MCKKSIIIIGKGPSVLRSSKKFVQMFDEVCICNSPVFSGYEKYIGNKANWHFRNKSTPKYSNDMLKELGNPKEIFSNKNEKGYTNFSSDWKSKFGAGGPSTGTMAFDWFVNHPDYMKICLVGFDLFPKDKRMYYFNTSEFNPEARRLIGSYYTKDGVCIKENGHRTDVTFEYMKAMFLKHKDKQFTLITNYEFPSFDNVEILDSANVS